MERFLGVLTEHYGGAFPLWLAPVQAVLIPISDQHLEYAQSVKAQLKARGFRVEVDGRSERMNLKIRQAQLQKVPYMLVVGNAELEQSTVSVRQRDGTNLGPISLDSLVQRFVAEIGSSGATSRAGGLPPES